MTERYDINALICPLCRRRWAAVLGLTFLAALVGWRPGRPLLPYDSICPPCWRLDHGRLARTGT